VWSTKYFKIDNKYIKVIECEQIY